LFARGSTTAVVVIGPLTTSVLLNVQLLHCAVPLSESLYATIESAMCAVLDRPAKLPAVLLTTVIASATFASPARPPPEPSAWLFEIVLLTSVASPGTPSP